MQKFYVTTPIYYVNDTPHIGHSYTTVLADVLTRFHKMIGYDTYFLTGTDEHGQKVQRAAEKRGVSPQTHVDEYSEHFKSLWEKMNISYNQFIRTTDPAHIRFVMEKLQELWDKGEIYPEEYEGWYSVGEERFFTEDELVDGKDPISGRPVEWLKEKNYFFRMGKYQERLIDYIRENPDWIVPDFRKNEVLGFLKQPLHDLCISRPKSRLSWGITLPFDNEYVTYVWFDALINYVSAVADKKYTDGSPIWPATYHLIGKDILTTHCVYWPTMLMALGIELPEHILAHGWWLVGDGSKMSKSGGTGVSPMEYMDKYGVDVFRYFLAREMVVGQDSVFSHEAFVRRVNGDLANDLGNVLNRVVHLSAVNFDGKLPAPKTPFSALETELRNAAMIVQKCVMEWIPQVKLSQVIEEVIGLARHVNRYLEQKAPWKLAKDESKKDELAATLYTAAEAVRLALSFLTPVMPQKTAEGLAMLGTSFDGIEDLKWGKLKGGELLQKGAPLFPRIEEEKTEAEKQPKPAQNKPLSAEDIPGMLELRAAKITRVKDHPDAQSLYVLELDAGDAGKRTVCSGLKNSYAASELQDKMVILFANLKAAALRGVMSHGMLLAGENDGKAVLIAPPENAEAGDRALFKGIPAGESRELKIKDFDKIQLKVKQGVVYTGEVPLEINGGPVTCEAPDNSLVH
ncbi:MAG: methionine--tRNA ligase [Fibrobacter sp.]|jgi:methionyl-tRNA synthetase|nr:methionine--tRNA ligase [Fibrobacter sp.]